MARRRGQRNVEKRRAVAAAARALLAERGRDVALAEVARRAGVSRQTLYNLYGGKAGLLSAAVQGPACMVPRLDASLTPGPALLAYAGKLLDWASREDHRQALRAAARGFPALNGEELAEPAGARADLAAYLSQQSRRGSLRVEEPAVAAAMFLDLVLAGAQLRTVLEPGPDGSPARADAAFARRCVQMFMRAHAPADRGRARPHPGCAASARASAAAPSPS